MKARVAILERLHAPLVIDEVEGPALGYGQVLVKMRASRICGSQIGEIDGVKGPDRFLPHLLGHEGSADVMEAGEGVTAVRPGDRVCLHWRPGAGIQSQPPKYRRRGQTVNAGWIATFAEYAIVSENRMTPVPKDLDDDTVCLLADTITTGFGIIDKDARLRIGESLLLVGCGGIGMGVLLGAKLAGAHPIVAVDLHARKLDKARELGATFCIHAGSGDWEARARELLEGGADVAIDGTGNPKVIETLYRLTRPRVGRAVLYGVMPADQRVSLHTLPLHFGQVLTGSEGGQSQPDRDIPRYVRMLRDGRFRAESFVSHRGRLEELNALICKMRAGEVLHALLQFDER